jgi:VanZ family protein
VRFIVFRVISAGWIAALVFGSLAPADDVQGAYVFGDFVLHAFGYAALTVLLVLSQRHPRIWVAGGAAVALGLVLEILQSFTGDRSASAIDVVANATGAAVAGAFCWWRRRLTAQPVGEI